MGATTAGRELLLRLAQRAERIAAYAQGKGNGGETVRQEIALVHRLLNRPPRLAVDIGANVGAYTAELRRRSPGLEIHAFEPAAVNSAKLNARFQGDKGIRVLPLAVSDKADTATLYSDAAGSPLGSLTPRRLDHFNIPFNVQETVATIRFEDYWRDRLGGRALDIVKMDIEGHELAALAGFGEAIHATAVLQFEFGGCNIDTRTYFQDFWYFFKDCGFRLFRITPLGLQGLPQYRESDEFFATTNYLALNLEPGRPGTATKV